MTFLRNLQPENTFHSKLIRESIVAVENWKIFKSVAVFFFPDETPSVEDFFSALDNPPEIVHGKSNAIFMFFFTRDLVQPAVLHIADIYHFDKTFDCAAEYCKYQRHRRDALLRWIKSILMDYSKHIFMKKILIAGIVLKNLPPLDFSRKWKWKDSAVISFLQSIGISAQMNFSDADFQAAENFIVDTLKKFCPNEIMKCNNAMVSSFFDTVIDAGLGLLHKKFNPADKAIDIPDADIAREESQANIIPFEVYQKHKNIIDAFKDDSTLIFDSDAKLYPSTAQIGNIEHKPRDKPSLLDKASALKELRRLA